MLRKVGTGRFSLFDGYLEIVSPQSSEKIKIVNFVHSVLNFISVFLVEKEKIFENVSFLVCNREKNDSIRVCEGGIRKNYGKPLGKKEISLTAK